jgi:hypothetical protein
VSKPVAPKNAIDMQRMLDTATAFFLAGERCAPPLSFGEYGLHRVDAPRIVSYALSVEMALKMLARNAGTFSAGHGLKKIYEHLPAQVRENLNYLDDHIDEIDNYFVDWRYSYEKDFLAGSADDIRRAFILCHQEIRRQLPDLMSTYERNWGKFEPDWQWAWYEYEHEQLAERA